MLYWVSWYQPTEDHRPLTYPPNKCVLGWWCTGYGDAGATLCALVVAKSEKDAKAVVHKDWPEAEEWRFCDTTENTTLSDRFPLSEWMQERIDNFNESNQNVSN